MIVGKARMDDGSEILVTRYETGEVTLARREKDWETWGVPAQVEWEPEYDYRAERRIEDVLSSHGLLWGERDD